MDPDANLKEQLAIANAIVREAWGHGAPTEREERLAELVLALDTWITSRGFVPARWSK